MVNEVADIEYTDSSFQCYEFDHMVLGSDVKFEILKMRDSVFIWIGDSLKPKFSDLSMAIKASITSTPIATKIMGTASTDTTSLGLAERLSKKLNKPVYVSFNTSITNNKMPEEIEKRLVREIEMNTDKF